MRNKLSELCIGGGLFMLIGSVGAYEHETITLFQLLLHGVVSLGMMITGKSLR